MADDSLDALPAHRPIVVHCATGYRSAIAASRMRLHGFQHVADLVGGLAAWESARLATVGGAEHR